MHADEDWLNALSWQAVGWAFGLLNAYRSGFLGEVPRNALAHEPRKAGLAVDRQHGPTVLYDSAVIGDYSPDLIMEHSIMVASEDRRGPGRNSPSPAPE
jgi:GxxExxY protein